MVSFKKFIAFTQLLFESNLMYLVVSKAGVLKLSRHVVIDCSTPVHIFRLLYRYLYLNIHNSFFSKYCWCSITLPVLSYKYLSVSVDGLFALSIHLVRYSLASYL